VRIAGDVQFANEVNWLVEHVRWDLEEDLSRLIGDAPAHAMAAAARQMVQALRQFVRPAASSGQAPAASSQPVAPGTAQPGADPTSSRPA
jgi:ubiquinone biosynthesis protein UbiJ